MTTQIDHDLSQLWRRRDCLDHGYVQLIDVMGDDQRIVDAARMSLSGGEGSSKATSDNQALIRYLYRHRHTTPFEMVEFTFDCKMPIFVARQWVRHRTASINELSGRYSEIPNEFYLPREEELLTQAKTSKQGTSETPLDPDAAHQVRDEMQESGKACFVDYRDWLTKYDLAREIARINLPLSTYTHWWWKIDLHNLFHFLSLRTMPTHADGGKPQSHIAVYADAMAEVVKARCPIAFQAFEDFRLKAVTLSRLEWQELKRLLGMMQGSHKMQDGEDFPTKREASEWAGKLKELGVG
jgi:thymidylate synthase (FAD)